MKKSTRFTFIWHRALMLIVLVVSGLGVIFNEDMSAKSEYLFTCWQSAKFLVVSCLPFFLKKLKLDIPDVIYIVFMAYIVCHFVLGEILDFYVKVSWWDSFLHFTSGMAIALLSFSFINLMNNNTDDFKINVVFAAFFAFSMTVMVGVMWEIIEFASDSWFSTNMQRAYVSTTNGRGAALIGQEALLDTMKDLILDAAGAFIMCFTCGLAILKKKINLDDLSFIKKHNKVVATNSENIENHEELTILTTNDEDCETKNLLDKIEDGEILIIEKQPAETEIIVEAETVKKGITKLTIPFSVLVLEIICRFHKIPISLISFLLTISS